MYYIFSIIGLIISIFDYYQYYIINYQIIPLCTTSKISSSLQINCNAVLRSQYSRIFSIPLDIFAMIYFLLDILIYRFFNNKRRIIFFWRLLGFLFVPYLIYTEIFLIHSICIYCTIMQLMIILNFIYLLYDRFSIKQPRSD